MKVLGYAALAVLAVLLFPVIITVLSVLTVLLGFFLFVVSHFLLLLLCGALIFGAIFLAAGILKEFFTSEEDEYRRHG